MSNEEDGSSRSPDVPKGVPGGTRGDPPDREPSGTYQAGVCPHCGHRVVAVDAGNGEGHFVPVSAACSLEMIDLDRNARLFSGIETDGYPDAVVMRVEKPVFIRALATIVTG